MGERRTKSNTGLSVVPANAKPPVAKADAKTLVDAISMGERDLLVTSRRTLAATIDAGPAAHAIAGLMRQMLEVDQKIRAIDLRAIEECSDAAETEDGDFDASAV